MKRFTKNIIKEFKHSFGRFVAIFAIVALGIGFLIGILQATPDMKHSMDVYYRRNAAYDLDVKGTYGLSEQDIAEIAALRDDAGNAIVSAVTPVVSTDAIVRVAGQNAVGRIIGLDFTTLNTDSSLNHLTLQQGRFPQAAGEVVAERSNNHFAELSVGETVTIREYGSYGDVYQIETFTVVGIVSSPDYYYNDGREISTIGTGVVGAVLYGQAYDTAQGQGDGIYDLSAPENPMQLFDSNLFSLYNYFAEEKILYTDCYVALTNSTKYEMFSDKYKNFVSEQAVFLEELGIKQSETINETLQKLEPLLSIAFTDAEWVLLDRATTNVSYVSFDLNVEKVEAIAGIFPIFFIVVAALVALTSMTRMVEEDRMQIGTFKALGYKNGKILSKYLFYCCLATFLGCATGILLGIGLLPAVIWQAYGTMYSLPALALAFEPVLLIAVSVVALVLTALVTLFACRASLKAKPSVLMQPKAPKPGKRILLERAGLLWKPLPFKWKATLRNIFRYKKNIVLTVLSVMGCTALILTGFGLNDSINAVAELQYGNVIRYDMVVEYTGELSEILSDEESELSSFLSDEDISYLSLYGESGQLVFRTNETETNRETIDLYLIENQTEFSSFVDLHERKNSAMIDTRQSGLILPENIAVVYNVQVGDTVTYVSAAKHSYSLTVSAICEYYSGSVAYMDQSAFAALMPEAELSYNTLFIRSGATSEEIDGIAEQLLKDAAVSSVEFTYTTIESFQNLSSTMGLVIIVLVISAGALAAIVLYNLTNINIEERRREIATLRVLGYRRHEVAGYIYRESAILTATGSLLGLLLGFLLHQYIVNRVDSVLMMFGRVIGGWSYLWALLLTIAFAAIVYAFMLLKLNRIDMAESLKSNE